MGGMIFVLAIVLIGLLATWYIEDNAERIEVNRQIGDLVKESKRRAGQKQGRNAARFATCGWAPPRKKGGFRFGHRHAIRRRQTHHC